MWIDKTWLNKPLQSVPNCFEVVALVTPKWSLYMLATIVTSYVGISKVVLQWLSVFLNLNLCVYVTWHYCALHMCCTHTLKSSICVGITVHHDIPLSNLIYSLMQKRRNSIALAMKLRLFCMNTEKNHCIKTILKAIYIHPLKVLNGVTGNFEINIGMAVQNPH